MSKQCRIVIAPDSFKGTATTHEAGRALGTGVLEIIPNADVRVVPMADGGEGTASCFGGEEITLPTTDARGELTHATYIFDDGKESGRLQAFIDVAAATGLPQVKDNPCAATGDTFGTGVLIADAVAKGATRITLGLGGSATVDGGTGILTALGAIPVNAKGETLKPGGAHLIDFDHFEMSQLNSRAAGTEFLLLADVDNPATGDNGAAKVFGPQKGATPDEVEKLDAALTHYVEHLGIDPNQAGLGAAGGVALGLMWLSGVFYGKPKVYLTRGCTAVAMATGLLDEIKKADLVITGEGAVDMTSFHGKVCGSVVGWARSNDVTPAIAAGRFDITVPDGIITAELKKKDDKKSTVEQLVQAGRDIAEAFLSTHPEFAANNEEKQ